jgi:facilitated trehalose transporter
MIIFQDLRAYLDGDLDRSQFQSKKHASLDVRSSKQLEKLLKGTSSSEEGEFDHQRKSFQARKHKSLDARHISFKFEKEPTPTPSTTSSEEDFEERSSLLHFDPDITKPIVVDLNVNIYKTVFHLKVQ